ncbi:hypothetical protein UCRPC4_g04993 [Phaeomoniella chlamydospora]|uniref:Uncharacterized protein n=1 Tax=Phaeomoniella chlamydospora TaxID=158046 RepID=A0A0G2E7T7_PHACM|nr:hypothetical protein UCRPC4_g04993 [Phaeomoniella chlamydospora]
MRGRGVSHGPASEPADSKPFENGFQNPYINNFQSFNEQDGSRSLPRGTELNSEAKLNESSSYQNPFTNEIPPDQVSSDLQKKNHPWYHFRSLKGQTLRPDSINWTPRALSKVVLALFALLFALIVASLQILHSVSQSNKGIIDSDDGQRYLWTYGPTAILVIVTVFWRQVEYAAKVITPWAELAKGPVTAERSLLLDYQTPFPLVSVWRALRNRHWAVALTIATMYLLKATTVLSAGLFILQPMNFEDLTTRTSLINGFTGSNFSHGLRADSRAAYSVFANQVYNVTLPSGTNEVYATQFFTSLRNGSNTLTTTAFADVFVADLSCESGYLTYKTSMDLESENTPVSTYYNTTVKTSDCDIYNAKLDAPSWYYPSGTTLTNQGYYASVQNVTCSNLPVDDQTRQRFMFAVAYSVGESQNNNTLLNSSNLVCIPTYEVSNAKVTLDTMGALKRIKINESTTRQLDGISGIDIAVGVMSSTQQASAVNYIIDDDLNFDVFFQLVAASMTSFKPESLLDPSYLKQVTTPVYQGVAAQLASLYLLQPEDNPAPVVGWRSILRNRLTTRQVPVRIMQGTSGAMMLFTVLIYITAPRGVVPRSPDSINAVAATMAQSPRLTESFKGTGHMKIDELTALLSKNRFESSISNDGGNPSFSIATQLKTPPELSITQKTSEIQWTRPLVFHRVTIAVSLIMPIAGIIILEVLLQISKNHSGLGDVNADGYERYSWLYVPVFVLVLFGALFDMLDFYLQMSEPYHALSRSYSNSQISVLYTPLRLVKLHAAWRAIRTGRFALLASCVAVTISPLLTIVASGLFSAIPVPSTSSLPAFVEGWFNTTGGSTYSLPPISALVLEGNMSYPQWTYGELALPRIAISDSTNTGNNGTVSVNVPAVRGAVNCELVPEARIFSNTIGYGQLMSNVSTPDGCGNSGWIGGPDIYLTNTLEIPQETGYYGQVLTLGFLANCTDFALYFGYVTDGNLDKSHVYTCTTGLERVMANTAFELPDYSISTDPIVDENSATDFSAWSEGYFDFQVLNITGTSSDQFDGTFNALVYGKDGIPPHELLEPDRFTSAFTHLYRQYVAQVVNMAFRVPVDLIPANETFTLPSKTLTASYTNPYRTRLIQSNLSTQLLVAIFCILFLCALALLFFIDMRHVLPKPVGSIAAVMSLLADSHMLTDPEKRERLFPPGSECWSDKQWKEQGTLDEMEFRMGWWDRFREPVEVDSSARRGLGEWDLTDVMGRSEEGGLTSGHQTGPQDLERRYFAIDARPKTVQENGLHRDKVRYIA